LSIRTSHHIDGCSCHCIWAHVVIIADAIIVRIASVGATVSVTAVTIAISASILGI
jgi:hypothetical protein